LSPATTAIESKVLGLRLSLVHVRRNAFGFGFTDSRPESLQLSTSQEALAAVLLELVDPAGRVHALRNNASPAGKGVHTADDRQHAVGTHSAHTRIVI
jgi:hypothetical protein